MLGIETETVLQGPDSTITIKRNVHGVPEITCTDHIDYAYAMGWIHAEDRQMQALLTRILIQGRASEVLSGDPELVSLDIYMRKMNFIPDPESEIKKLKPHVRQQMIAYCDGFNNSFARNGSAFEFKFLGYKPEPWEIKDCMAIGKIMGFFGQTDAQGAMEKFLVQMIQNDVDQKKIKELFPYLKEKIDYALMKKVILEDAPVPEALRWLNALPRMTASNNWAVSGTRSASGKPFLCNDPHLEVTRLPGIWQEVIVRLPDNYCIGAGVPGMPGLVIGRTKHVAWGATFAYMDMMDFRIEYCRDGMYQRGKNWNTFTEREEVFRVKRGKPFTRTYYENEHGVLEGDPKTEGHYLVMNWAAQRDCGADLFNSALELPNAKNTKDMMKLLGALDSIAISWAIADNSGNIGYQMSGRQFNRPKNVSGLMPLPGWEKKYDPRGFVKKSDIPAAYNPKEGFLCTANNDLNHLGKSKPINLPMGPYRAERIAALLKKENHVTVNYMKKIHYDLYSTQAARFMEILKPLLPDTPNGKLLRDWDCTYNEESVGAALFESVYRELVLRVFGDNGMGRDVMEHLLKETTLFAEYYANFDTILLKKTSPWFGGDTRDDIFISALKTGLECDPVPYGDTRMIKMKHLIFGDKLPQFLGFDYKPFPLPGSRATVQQGQIFKAAGRMMSFSPSFRLIADMGTDELHTNIAGGPSDRRFSKWYISDVENWRNGIYKVLK